MPDGTGVEQIIVFLLYIIITYTIVQHKSMVLRSERIEEQNYAMFMYLFFKLSSIT